MTFRFHRNGAIRTVLSVAAVAGVGRCARADRPAASDASPLGYCNPLNLDYRFVLKDVSKTAYREAADPTLVVYRNQYWLFASKSGGYWRSADMRSWQFIPTAVLPTEEYAPDVHVSGDALYFVAGSGVFRSTDPAADHWTPVAHWGGGDPAMFQDDDGKVYFYSGCSDKDPICGQEVDPKTMTRVGPRVPLISGDLTRYGWERSVVQNGKPRRPYIEGAFMNKHDGRYYLQFAAPGTQLADYADGVYTSPNPLGPFTYAANNPFSLKPGGFVTGAGHGSTFTDLHGNLWHIATVRVSVKGSFERRIGLFPAGFDAQGNLFCNTSFGDYPTRVPDRKWDPWADPSYGWMLLSYHGRATASSSLPGHGPELAVDEDVRDYWSAKTGDAGEWLQVDLGAVQTVRAVQVNFAENDCKQWGRDGDPLYQQYLLEGSTDGTRWWPLIDRRQNRRDVPHDYVELPSPAEVRLVRLANGHVPAGGTFAVSGLRLFGSGHGKPPPPPTGVRAVTPPYDALTANLAWTASPSATGYNVHWGIAPDKLYESWLVYDATDLAIPSLSEGQQYWLRIDAFNENGVACGQVVQVAGR